MMPVRSIALIVVFAAVLAVGHAAWAGEPDVAGGAVAVAGKAEEIARQFFAEADADKRAELAGQFAAVAPKSVDDLRKLLRRAAAFPDVGFGVHRFETAPEGDVPAIRYVVSVPEGYSRDSVEGWPLVIGCHGTGGTGTRYLGSLANLLGDDLGKVILACPDAPYDGTYRFFPLGVTYPLHVLADVRHRVNINSDRVVLTGYSKGGYTAWSTALFSPGEWGGAAPMACFPITEAGRNGIELYLQNVLTVPIQYHWGDQDILQGQTEGINTFGRMTADEMKRLGAGKFEPIEYKGEGHSLKIQADAFRRFLASARRDPFPAEFRMVFHHVWQGRAFCVRATEASGPDLDFRKLPPIRVGSPDQVQSAVMRFYRSRALELRVTVNRKTNAVVVRARNLKEIEVALSPQQLDFSRPIRVSVNGRIALVRKPGIDYGELLETARSTYDFERLVGARATIPVGR